MPSWKKILQSGSVAHILNITASNISQSYQTKILMYDSGSGVITYGDYTYYVPPDLSSVAGTLKYFNQEIVNGELIPSSSFTPMSSVRIQLIRSGSNQTFSSLFTNASGEFNLGNNIPYGDYYIKVQNSKPWGGVNTADASIIQNGVISLAGLNYLTADVNGDASVNSTDAGLILNRFVIPTPIPSGWITGDWIYELSGSVGTYWYSLWGGNSPQLNPNGIPITINGPTYNIIIWARCMGDVNGDYIPPQ